MTFFSLPRARGRAGVGASLSRSREALVSVGQAYTAPDLFPILRAPAIARKSNSAITKRRPTFRGPERQRIGPIAMADLASWNDGTSKRAIEDFVRRVSATGSRRRKTAALPRGHRGGIAAPGFPVLERRWRPACAAREGVEDRLRGTAGGGREGLGRAVREDARPHSLDNILSDPFEQGHISLYY